ncbi:MAG: peptide ABC transporter permease [Devosia sp. 67-54]|uniref:ABC transporter permease n=1 Tax=unclassified Devosia TaxID=196773 RepID=UPI00095F2BFC|nr:MULTISPECIES: ABC transporter permease [unclassified Devosia]MBN9304705.1 ABC transporter permease [Devosia sp.]OJX15320.1 MAG: peptide ABC transporter permease [Devosia sp. 67-54]
MALVSATGPVDAEATRRRLPGNAATHVALGIVAVYVLLAVVSPLVLGDYISVHPATRLKPPSATFWFGTDQLGRGIFERTLVGTGNSLLVGACVALLATLIGGGIGLVAGYFRTGEWVIMRLMDGLMAVPSVLLAIALASLLGAGLTTVIIAIAVPEIPRMVRLVRSVVLALRQQPYVLAAISIGTRPAKILFRHILPNAVGALTVQATYVCASAIITESILSFLGIGSTPDSPSWGSIMAYGRPYFQVSPWMILFPGVFLSVLVLTINILGDGLRDMLDPRLRRGATL